jgi:purine nucleosidase
VYGGSAQPLSGTPARCNLVHGEDGLGGVQLPAGQPAAQADAVDYLCGRLRAAEPPSLIALGPLTNLAKAEALSPGLLRGAPEILVMGGAFFCPGNVVPHAEFNFYADPDAARVVLASGARLVLFGLDVTSQAVMPAAWISALREIGSPAATAAYLMLEKYAHEDPLLHDVCPVAFAMRPGLFELRAATASIVTTGAEEGRSVATLLPKNESDGAGLRIALKIDTAGLLRTVHESIAALPR